MDLVNTQLVATQRQLQLLEEKHAELTVHHSTLLQEVIGLQKTVVNHEHVIQDVMSFLHTIDTQRRRDSKTINPFAAAGPQNGNGPELLGDDDDMATPLAHADKLLSDLHADAIINSKSLEQINETSIRMNGVIATPPPSDSFRHGPRPTSRGGPHSASSSGTMRYGELENIVYPVGRTNGIDPMYSEHVHNIPYPMPTKPTEPTDPRFAAPVEPRRKNNLDPGWIRQPQILLVEDDQTCRRIGGKFLYAFNCSIDSAVRSSHCSTTYLFAYVFLAGRSRSCQQDERRFQVRSRFDGYNHA